jgi:hypothetical protein
MNGAVVSTGLIAGFAQIDEEHRATEPMCPHSYKSIRDIGVPVCLGLCIIRSRALISQQLLGRLCPRSRSPELYVSWLCATPHEPRDAKSSPVAMKCISCTVSGSAMVKAVTSLRTSAVQDRPSSQSRSSVASNRFSSRFLRTRSGSNTWPFATIYTPGARV